MMVPTFKTARSLAKLFSEIDRGAQSAEYIHRQIRNFNKAGVIRPSAFEGEGRTASALYDVREGVIARVAQFLAFQQFTSDSLQDIRRTIINADDFILNAVNEDGSTNPDNQDALATAIMDVYVGKPAFYHLYLSPPTNPINRTFLCGETRKTATPWIKEDIATGPAPGALVIDLKKLCGPVVQAYLEATEGSVDTDDD